MRLAGPPQPVPRAATVDALLALAARHASGVTFLDLRERELHLGWAEVHARARRAAAALHALGIVPGDRVAIVLRTEPAFLDAFFGALLAGAIPVPLYPPVRLGRMEEYVAATARMVQVAGARLVLAHGAVRRLLGEVVARARPELGCRAADALERGHRELARESRPGDLALVQFSSGSTVDPKPVALTHAAVVAQTASILEVIRPTPQDRLVSWLPLYHDMGLIGCLLGAASYPGPLVLIPPEHFLARPALWLRALARHGGTISAAPSFAYAYAADRVRDEELAGLDLSRWRVALDGAEPVAADVLRRFAERFAPFGFDAGALLPVYGLSEAALAVTFTPAGRGAWRSRRVDPVALAARGEVEQGPREVVSVGAPDELEAPLAAVRGVRPGCAVALGFEPDGEGEELLLLAERAGPAEDDAAVAEAARRAVLERTGVRAHTVTLLAPGTLPRTSSGKMRRGEALRRFLAGELTPPRKVTVLAMAKAVARSSFAYARAKLG